MDDKVKINGKEYQVGKLRCKHLRKISEYLKDNDPEKNKGFESIDRYMPMLLDSLKTYNADITQDVLDEMDLQEFNDAWAKVVSISGVQIISGEAKPTRSNGGQSTVESQPQLGGTSVQ